MPEHRSPAAPRWAHRLRRALTGALWLVALWWFGGWLWDQPFMERPRMLWQINRMDAPVALPVPVQGVAARRIADTWHGPRDGGTRRRDAGLECQPEPHLGSTHRRETWRRKPYA